MICPLPRPRWHDGPLHPLQAIKIHETVTVRLFYFITIICNDVCALNWKCHFRSLVILLCCWLPTNINQVYTPYPDAVQPNNHVVTQSCLVSLVWNITSDLYIDIYYLLISNKGHCGGFVVSTVVSQQGRDRLQHPRHPAKDKRLCFASLCEWTRFVYVAICF